MGPWLRGLHFQVLGNSAGKGGGLKTQVIGDAGSGVARGARPLFEGGESGVALVGIFNDSVAGEAAAVFQTLANGAAGEE